MLLQLPFATVQELLGSWVVLAEAKLLKQFQDILADNTASLLEVRRDEPLRKSDNQVGLQTLTANVPIVLGRRRSRRPIERQSAKSVEQEDLRLVQAVFCLVEIIYKDQAADATETVQEKPTPAHRCILVLFLGSLAFWAFLIGDFHSRRLSFNSCDCGQSARSLSLHQQQTAAYPRRGSITPDSSATNLVSDEVLTNYSPAASSTQSNRKRPQHRKKRAKKRDLNIKA
mmetsp:Transcript_102592/g.328717  ORF Transcript_102592/g.328717 Transcript_102592/m.328717 type:complete len:229 (+) Transcript_102592:727-1413(+)